jgi:hypothetical protein
MTGSTHTYLNLINSGLVTHTNYCHSKYKGFLMYHQWVNTDFHRKKQMCKRNPSSSTDFWSLQRFGETHHLCPQPGFLEFLRPPTGRPRLGSTFWGGFPSSGPAGPVALLDARYPRDNYLNLNNCTSHPPSKKTEHGREEEHLIKITRVCGAS